MYKIYRLDLMIAYSCNLSCAGCISISDIKRSGIEPTESLITSINKWKLVLEPAIISIFGGEPCLHPDLQYICDQVRKAWPKSTIRLITNGYLLDNFDLSKWFNFEPIEIQVSIHRKDHEAIINEKIKNILNYKSPWTVTKHGKEFREHKQISWTHGKTTIYKSIFNDFVMPYKKNKGTFAPWNSDPAEAIKICGSPSTPILYKGKLYKCPPVANIIDIVKENWFDYSAIDVDDDIETFVKNIGRPESVCGQCPEQSHAVIINHFDKENVIVRQNIS
jgi:organic radical activating enzyme